MRKRLVTIVVVVLIIGGLGTMMSRRKGPEVEVLHPYRGAIRESFREPGMTRLENTWRVTAQVAGRIGRINLEPGDSVQKGQVLAEYDLTPFDKAIAEATARVAQLEATLNLVKDARVEQTTLSEARETLKSAQEAAQAARSRVESAQARVEVAEREFQRMEQLAAEKFVSSAELDRARLSFDTARQDLEGAKADMAAAEANQRAIGMSPRRIEQQIDRKDLQEKETAGLLEQAKAALELAQHDRSLAKIESPIDGVVLQRYDRGERPVMAGAELVLLGSPKDIEVIVDVLSQDALKLKPGGEALLDSELGGLSLEGFVKRVEPQGFTKLSSLGVEQQRVNVIVQLKDAPETLGVGYRLNARFLTGSKADALLIPRFSALQAPDNTFYVFGVRDQKLRRMPVRLGLKSDLELEALDGVTEQDWIVAAPDATMEENRLITPIESPWRPTSAEGDTKEPKRGAVASE